MNNKITKFYLIVIVIFLSSCFNNLVLKVPIDKNKVTGMTMKFTSLNFTVNDGESFLHSQKGLQANRVKLLPIQMKQLTEINYILKATQNNKLKNYDLEISKSGETKKYYGRIVFFNINKNSEANPVGKFREISVDNSYFQNATNGRTAIVFEYFTDDKIAIPRIGLKIPTWVLLLSDEPL